MNELYNFFKSNKGNQINKWIHYFEIYETYFSRYRDQPIVFLEIGVQNGGSYKMFREYFGEKAHFIGIDVDPRCKRFEEPGFEVFIGSQKDKKFLSEILKSIPKIDIILDDGGHTMNQQKNSFEVLFEHLNPNGVYLIEDTHTSYWNAYGGGYKRLGTFIEYSKNFVDVVHGFHFSTGNAFIKKYKTNIKAVHFYDSIVVLEKAVLTEPKFEIIGTITEQYLPVPKKLKYLDLLLSYLNKLLGFFRLPSIDLPDNFSR